MIATMLVFALLGTCLFALVSVLAPARPSPVVQLGRFDAHLRGEDLATARTQESDRGRHAGRLGAKVVRELDRRGVGLVDLQRDLALTGQDLSEVMGRKVAASVVGFVLSLVILESLLLGLRWSLPFGTPFAVGLLAAGGFFFLPDVDVRRLAAQRRSEFREALSAYLELVSLEMAASAAPAQALTTASHVGAGWPMALLRDTLFRATRSGRDQWAALADLGERIGVSELRDLGVMVRMVENDGARVRSTLSARATTMRRHSLALAEGSAEVKGNSMKVAQIPLFVGFTIFLGYPAIAAVLAL